MRDRHVTKLGVSKIERKEAGRLVTGVPALVAALFNLKEGTTWSGTLPGPAFASR
jgi:hypothetical protein